MTADGNDRMDMISRWNLSAIMPDVIFTHGIGDLIIHWIMNYKVRTISTVLDISVTIGL